MSDAPSDQALLARLAGELDATRIELEALGVALCGDPAVARDHMTRLQSLDRIGQRCAAIATILRADDLLAATGESVLESIAALN